MELKIYNGKEYVGEVKQKNLIDTFSDSLEKITGTDITTKTVILDFGYKAVGKEYSLSLSHLLRVENIKR